MEASPSRWVARSLVFPLEPVSRRARIDRLAQKLPLAGPIRCTVCGRWSLTRRFGEYPRETGRCIRCGAHNRHRQLAAVACSVLGEMSGREIKSLASAPASNAQILNTEARGPVHHALSSQPGYIAAEYFGDDHAPGESVGGIRHENLTELSFAPDELDLVLSSDVFEHIPKPYEAHAEIARVLKAGGHHVFTVPFLLEGHRDDVRAILRGTVVEHRAEPIYHDDPLRPEGALVYTVFGLEMLVRLSEMGFETSMYRLHSPGRGILGQNALVFDARKQP